MTQHYSIEGKALCYGGTNCDVTRNPDFVTCKKCLEIGKRLGYISIAKKK
jgi:hypothetical protein